MNQEERKAQKKAWEKANSEKRKAQKRARYAANPEKVKARVKARVKAWRLANPEKRKVWRQANSEKIKAQRKTYYIANSEKIKTQTKAYREANAEKIKVRMKTHYDTNSEKIKTSVIAYRTNRRKTDVNFKLACNLRGRLRMALKKNYKAGSAVRDLGRTIPELKVHIESLFKPGMTWDNYGNKEGCWSIDHIKPLSKFDVSDRQQLLEACHYTNLQPMWHILNIKKGSKILP